ncbi:hypothetical protein BC834DRAFT_869859 [Gloeopeniophorella convolvens]|nr:hypothetical protein BC834DRAFT_869859 [Gloeopeniophorella convolvens]
MLSTAKKHKVAFAPIRMTIQQQAALPAWFRRDTEHLPVQSNAAKCLLQRHNCTLIKDLLLTTRRLRPSPHSPHNGTDLCDCEDCRTDRNLGCAHPNECAFEALTRLTVLPQKANPLIPSISDGLSLTRRRISMNKEASRKGDAILFNPAIPSSDNVTAGFRLFVDTTKLTQYPAQRPRVNGIVLRRHPLTIYTAGSCLTEGTTTARCGSGTWASPGSHLNITVRVPGTSQSTFTGDLVAIIMALKLVPDFLPLTIRTTSQTIVDGLTEKLESWEDRGWIAIKNANWIKLAAYLLRKRSAPTYLEVPKRDQGSPGQRESRANADEGARKEHIDDIADNIPPSFDLQGASLPHLTQANAYAGILSRQPPFHRPATNITMEIIREALLALTNRSETPETIWLHIRDKAISSKIRQFLYKAAHNTQKIGQFWIDARVHEDRAICGRCGYIESMQHLLFDCNRSPNTTIWNWAWNLWPYAYPQWPDLSLGSVLGCGSLSFPGAPRRRRPHGSRTDDADETPRREPSATGAKRLMTIIISETAHLIWAIRCDVQIQGKRLTLTEISNRWVSVLNARLTDDRLTATAAKRSKKALARFKNTWEDVLAAQKDLPEDWVHNREVLVGLRQGHT